MAKKLLKFSVLFCCSTVFLSAFAARPIDLSQQPIDYLQSFALPKTLSAAKNANQESVKEESRSTDFNQTVHVRMKQFYAGYPVWGADAVLHIPKGNPTTPSFLSTSKAITKNSTMNGTFYEGLSQDIPTAPPIIFTSAQAKKAIERAIATYEHTTGVQVSAEQQQAKLIVYLAEDGKAHWAFHVSFYVEANGVPSQPNYILDALCFLEYEAWNEVKTLQGDKVLGGGFGGNIKMGKQVYDGFTGHLPTLDMTRDKNTQSCYLANEGVSVTDFRTNKLVTFSCAQTDPTHGNIYWDGDLDNVHYAYSPSNDALFGGKQIKDLYQAWFGIPVLTDQGKPMLLQMVTHSPNKDRKGNSDPDNAQWVPAQKKMYFGDGEDYFFPLTSLDIAAHEVSHGFTEQHANLHYAGQPGGMNEAFSDMAAQAAEFFTFKQNDWKIGANITIAKGTVLRYLDEPTKDCAGLKANEECSIDNAKDFRPKMNVHFSSGVYNRAFYLLSTAPDWDVRKAFEVMVQANSHYWTPTTNFAKGACGVIKAANDYKYSVDAVQKAFAGVGIDTSDC